MQALAEQESEKASGESCVSAGGSSVLPSVAPVAEGAIYALLTEATAQLYSYQLVLCV